MSPAEPRRALIVEDDPVVARSVARRLLREGYTVSLAQTCRAARAAGGDFDAAVFDLDLPDGNGADLALELLRLGALRALVFYTGSIDRQERERAARLGSVIDKGEALDEVVAALGPFPTAPPASQMAPAARPRGRSSNARLTRVAAEATSERATATRSRR